MCLQLNLWDRKIKSSRRLFFQQILLFWNVGQQNELDASFDPDVTELSWSIKRQSVFPRILPYSDKWAINWKVYHRGETA